MLSTRFGFGSRGYTSHIVSVDDNRENLDRGFIKIRVNETSFEASIAALKLASPVLHHALDDANLGPVGHEAMSLEGSEKAVRIFLAILHYRFAEVPANLNLSDLFDMASLVAKYQCAHIIYPWAATWIKNCKNEVSNAHAHKALWIAYCLGDDSWCKEMFKIMTLHAKCHKDTVLNEKGEKTYILCNDEGAKLQDMVLPELLLGECTL